MTPVIFDLDGTLIDSLPNITDAANALLAEEGRAPLHPGTIAGFVGWGEGVFIDRLIAGAGLDAGGSADLLARFMVHYELAGHETRLMPGAAAALAALRTEGVPMGLVTNKPRAPLLPVLEATVLGEFMDVAIAGDDLAVRKPDPAPLLEAVGRLGAGRCIYVGDSEVDAETAERAGMPFVLYTLGIRRAGVDEIPHAADFDDFAQLAGICRRLG